MEEKLLDLINKYLNKEIDFEKFENYRIPLEEYIKDEEEKDLYDSFYIAVGMAHESGEKELKYTLKYWKGLLE